MSRETLEMAHYRLPALHDYPKERCRDCQEQRRASVYGNSIGCNLHQVPFVRHSHRCDAWHKRGTLL